MSLVIARASSDDEIRRCWPVMVELRPHIASADDLLAAVRRQESEGYRLIARSDGDRPLACAGYRVMTMLSRGRHIYVDDLVTMGSERSRGHGRALLEWIAAAARDEGAGRLQLDSGTHRTDAHRFYHREGMTISAFHFGRAL